MKIEEILFMVMIEVTKSKPKKKNRRNCGDSSGSKKDTADNQDIRYQVCFVSEKLALQALKPLG